VGVRVGVGVGVGVGAGVGVGVPGAVGEGVEVEVIGTWAAVWTTAAGVDATTAPRDGNVGVEVVVGVMGTVRRGSGAPNAERNDASRSRPTPPPPPFAGADRTEADEGDETAAGKDAVGEAVEAAWRKYILM
jgi:hypothetical protein